MRKVAFILTIALVFLVGETIVLNQTSLAMETSEKKVIVCWIPIDQNCNVVFDEIKLADKIKLISEGKGSGKGKGLFKKFKGTIHEAKTIGLIKAEPNPTNEYCFWFVQEGVLREK